MTTTTTLGLAQTAALIAASDELQAAKAARAAKDTPTHRAAVEAALTRIDDLLDGWEDW